MWLGLFLVFTLWTKIPFLCKSTISYTTKNNRKNLFNNKKNKKIKKICCCCNYYCSISLSVFVCLFLSLFRSDLKLFFRETQRQPKVVSLSPWVFLVLSLCSNCHEGLLALHCTLSSLIKRYAVLKLKLHCNLYFFHSLRFFSSLLFWGFLPCFSFGYWEIVGKEKKGKVKFVAFLAPNEWRCWVSWVTNNESFELDCFFKF